MFLGHRLPCPCSLLFQGKAINEPDAADKTIGHRTIERGAVILKKEIRNGNASGIASLVNPVCPEEGVPSPDCHQQGLAQPELQVGLEVVGDSLHIGLPELRILKIMGRAKAVENKATPEGIGKSEVNIPLGWQEKTNFPGLVWASQGTPENGYQHPAIRLFADIQSQADGSVRGFLLLKKLQRGPLKPITGIVYGSGNPGYDYMRPCPPVAVIKLKANPWGQGIKRDAFRTRRRHFQTIHEEVEPGYQNRSFFNGEGQEQGQIDMLKVRLTLISFKVCIRTVTVGSRYYIDIRLGRSLQREKE